VPRIRIFTYLIKRKNVKVGSLPLIIKQDPFHLWKLFPEYHYDSS
jgi:hypothetical protein